MCVVLLWWDQVESQWKYVGRTVLLPTHWERHFSKELTEWLRTVWKDPHAVEGCWRCHLLLHFHCVQCWHHISRQNRHNMLELHRPAFVTNFACCSLPAIFHTLISALSLPLVLSLLPTLLPICLIFTISVQPLPPIVSSIFFRAANSPIFLPHWKGERVFHQSSLCLALSN